MGLLDNVGGILKQAGDGIASAAEKTSKVASDAFDTAVEEAKAGANAVATVVRDADAKKQQIGAWIDAKEQQLEHKVDEGRAWLRENGGVAGKVASDQIELVEGVGTSLYGTSKGIVQLADGVTSLTNPLEWAANTGANVARLKSAAGARQVLGQDREPGPAHQLAHRSERQCAAGGQAVGQRRHELQQGSSQVHRQRRRHRRPVLRSGRRRRWATSAERRPLRETSAKRPPSPGTSAKRLPSPGTSARRPPSRETSAKRLPSPGTSARRPPSRETSAKRPASPGTSAERPPSPKTPAR